jgi:hypothetical protein
VKLTNTYNLPQPLVEAVANDAYNAPRRPRSISVTTLFKPPRIVALERKHHDELEVDVIDSIWSLLGQSVHSILERANKSDIVEQRFGVDFEGWYISGQLDSFTLHDGLLRDWKTTSAWTVARSSKEDDWTQQLNVYAWLLRKAGYEPKALQVVAIIRDWSKREAARNADYPQKQVEVVSLELWPDERVELLIRARLALHEEAEAELPKCSDAERWCKPARYAVMKVGRKSAVKLFDHEHEAKEWIRVNGKPGEKLSVELRKSEAVRCASYCGVAKFCDQWAADPANVPTPPDLNIDI